MSMTQLAAALLTASHPLDLPGGEQARVLNAGAVERLARESELPRWEIEALALEVGLVPLHYLRNRAGYNAGQQARLLRSRIALVGGGALTAAVVERLAGAGVGRFRVLLAGEANEGAADREQRLLQDLLRNHNCSAEGEVGEVDLRRGDPMRSLAGANVVVSCLQASADEMMLQVICRRSRLPMVLLGASKQVLQCTTILPDDPGVALVYRPTHLHIESVRKGPASRRALLLAGQWGAEQALRLLLDDGELLRDRLLFADLDAASIVTQNIRPA